MAVKPVFAVDFYGRLYMGKEIEFQSVGASSGERRKRNIQRLHDAFLEDYPYRNILEISDYSSVPEGIMLSDTHLTVPMSDGREVTVAKAFQTAKILTEDGSEVTEFSFDGESFSPVPRNFFYNWIYIRGLLANSELAEKLMAYDSFTDITFIPEKRTCCSAEAAAFYVALRKKGLLEKALNDRVKFAQILHATEQKIISNNESILAVRHNFERGSVKITSRRRSAMKGDGYHALLDKAMGQVMDSENDGMRVDEMMERWEESIRQVKAAEKPQREPAVDTESREIRKGMGILQSLTLQAKELQQRLAECVYGQEHAVNTFVSGYFQSQVTVLSEPERMKPRATFLFAGAPGVGKTFLAETAAKILELPFARFDMSEYSDKEASLEFIGSDKVYKNGREGNVTSYVKAHPHSVLLFDEVEKAHLTIIHLFLQMLDAGRLRDSFTDEEISFKDTIIIMTTNAGRQLYEDSRIRNLSGISRRTIIKALQLDVDPDTGIPRFPAAICSRFASGNVVMFNYMESHHLKQIAGEKLKKMAQSMKNSFGLEIEIDDDVSSALLFAEGGNADARTVSGRAETFFNEELFELFRHLTAVEGSSTMQYLEKVHFKVDIDRTGPEVQQLFRPQKMQNALIFADRQTVEKIGKGTDGCRIFGVMAKTDAEDILRQEDIAVVFVEPVWDKKKNAGEYLNMEDIPSDYIDFYNEIREKRPGMPIYLLETGRTQLRQEEIVSFMQSGVRGICDMTIQSVNDMIAEICSQLHQQKAMEELDRYHQVVGYSSGQRLLEDGKVAEISLIDLELKYAVDAGDSEKLLADATKPDIRFEDIIGADDAKDELKFFAECLKHPQRYIKKGLRLPKGVLLYGPPGTGKTMLAKAMAAQADMTFITAEGGQFLKKYLGEGTKAVHDLFKTARKYAPAIVFIDEIDAIGRQRSGEDGNKSAEVLNALLTEMDGFRNETEERVFVLAATNYEVGGRGVHSLDDALVRRFDRTILVELPNKEQRQQFLQMKVGRNPALTVSIEKISNLASRSTGMSLALLDSVLELALRDALRQEKDRVNDDMVEEAFEAFNSGREKKWDPKQLCRTARHEAGHALISWMNGEVPVYLTIAARSNYGGYMQQEQAEDKGIWTREEMLGRIRTALGGRAAEMVYYGREEGITTGAAGDLETATRLAEYMICRCGMDEEAGLIVTGDRNCVIGEQTVSLYNRINNVLSSELEKAIDLVRKHRSLVDQLVEVLMQESHIDGLRIRAIFEGQVQSNEKAQI